MRRVREDISFDDLIKIRQVYRTSVIYRILMSDMVYQTISLCRIAYKLNVWPGKSLNIIFNRQIKTF